jgi:thioredoxin-like negative regulator of GroEL
LWVEQLWSPRAENPPTFTTGRWTITQAPQLVDEQAEKPRLVFFYSRQSGRCRRAEGFMAQVLQRRRNHETFSLYRVDAEDRPDLTQRFRVTTLPTLVVVDGKRVSGRLEAPRGCRDIENFLAPWLR